MLNDSEPGSCNTAMFLEDSIDAPTALGRSPNHTRRATHARHVLYLQLFALIPTVVMCRSEESGYGAVLQSALLTLPLPVIGSMEFLFPFAILALLAYEHPPERWSWFAFPLSLAMSFSQLLALLPAVQ